MKDTLLTKEKLANTVNHPFIETSKKSLTFTPLEVIFLKSLLKKELLEVIDNDTFELDDILLIVSVRQKLGLLPIGEVV